MKRFISYFLLVIVNVLLLSGCNDSAEQAVRCESHFKAKSYPIAVKYCQPAAQEGQASAQYYLAMMYISGDGLQQDRELGYSWMKQAAEQGYEKAIFYDAVYQLISGKDKQQKIVAMKIMQGFADDGDPVAQYWMGNTFLFGYLDDTKSVNEAVYWYQLAIKHQHYPAMNNLAWIKVSASHTELFDPKEGLRLALLVAKKYPKSHGYLDTLAAAYAANGEFIKAIELQHKVIALAKKSGCEECQKFYLKHLEQYLQQKPLEEDLYK